MKKLIKKVLREHCPNISFLRTKLNEAKLREVHRYTMSPEDIRAVENNPADTDAIVEKYSSKWPQYTGKLNAQFDGYVQHCEALRTRPDLAQLRRKMLFDCYAYGFAPDEYFVYELEQKSLTEKMTYCSNTDVMDMVYHVNDIVDLGIYFDKEKTFRKFKKYYKRDAVALEKASDFSAFSAFVQKHPVFVKKNVALSKGDSVELVDSAASDRSLKELFDSMISVGKHIVEERVIQSDRMAALNASSVNTIRVITFGTENGVQVGPCFLKVGRNGSFVDNGGKGGILVGIDNRTGILNTVGYDEYLEEYPVHPDTDVEFVGYQLPDWDAVRKLAVELSAQTPSVRYVGWDFAHTEKGWIVIEGNGSSQMIGPQIVYKRGFKKDIQVFLKQ